MKLTVFALLAGSWAWAQGGPGGRGPIEPRGPQWQNGRRPTQLVNDPQMAERLGLSADQKKKVEAATQEHRLKRIDLNAALQKAQITLEPLINAEQPNENQILSQIDRVTQAQAELQKDEMRLQLELRRVLTTEQWRRLQQERPQPGQPKGPPPRN